MYLVDILIVVFVIGAVLRSVEVGLLRQLLTSIALAGGLWLGILLQPYMIGLVEGDAFKTIITIASLFVVPMILVSVGQYVVKRLRRTISRTFLPLAVRRSLAGILAGVSMLLVAWLGGAVLLSIPSQTLKTFVQDSHIVAYLDQHLPSLADPVIDLSYIRLPNDFPNVFAGIEPQPTVALPQPGLEKFTAAIAHDQPSVVRIGGDGCGGIVEGSGFVVAKGIVVTNAHVVAGVDHIIVQSQAGNFQAVMIDFDPNLDLAVLRVDGLNLPKLDFDMSLQPHGKATAVLGYPGGHGFKASSAVIGERVEAVGHNIYDKGNTKRLVYELQSHIVSGNSGGPVITTSGKVVGVVFARSTRSGNVGYALDVNQVTEQITSSRKRNQVQNNQTCVQ